MGPRPCGLTGRGRTVERTVPAGLWPEERPRGSKDSGQHAGPEGKGHSCRASGVGAPWCHQLGGMADMLGRGAAWGPVRGRGVCGAALGPCGLQDPRPCPCASLTSPCPASPAPAKAASWLHALWTSLHQVTPGQLPGGRRPHPAQRFRLSVHFWAGLTAWWAQGGFAGGHSPLRPLGGSPQGLSGHPRCLWEPQVHAVYLTGADGAAPPGAASGDTNPQSSWAPRPPP